MNLTVTQHQLSLVATNVSFAIHQNVWPAISEL